MHSDDISLLVYIIQVGIKNKIKKEKFKSKLTTNSVKR